MTDLSALILAQQNAKKPGQAYWSTRTREVARELLSLAETLPNEYRAVRNHSDDNLSPEGLQAAREAMAESIRNRVTQTARTAAETAGTALTEATKAAARYRPAYDPSDVAQLTRTEQAWRMAIQPQLDAGKQWPEIIANLDHDGLLAVQRFAPQYEMAKRDRFTQHEVPAVVENLQRLTDKRVVESAPEGPARDAMRELVEVRELHEATVRSAAWMAEATERDAVNLSINVKRELFAAGANPAPAGDASAA